MIIYRDVVTGDELFSDAFVVREVEDGLMYEVEGKRVVRTEDLDDNLWGANASAEEQGESCETASASGIDIILNHSLQETSYSKKDYTVYIKGYVKRLKTKLEEEKPDRVADFVAGAPQLVKKLLGNHKNYQFYTGESNNPDGMVALLDYREDQITPFMLFFKDGLLIEKF